MTSLAPSRRAVGSDELHSLRELSFVGVVVATGAAQVVPVIFRNRLRLKLRGFLVAIGTRYRDVASGQYKLSFLVLGQCKCGGFVSLKIVTTVARVEIRSRRELCGMAVAVAIGTAFKFDLEQRVLPFRYVTLLALQAGMASLQRICA